MEVGKLAFLQDLKTLNVMGNPICELEGMHSKIFYLVPQLGNLNGYSYDMGGGVVRRSRSTMNLRKPSVV